MRLWQLCACLIALSLAGVAHAGDADERGANGGVRVKYWEKWTGFEKDAMQAVIDDFNRLQHRIYVEYITVSNVNQKTLLATAGGHPPDLAGGWAPDVIDFADKDALIPLDDFLRGTNVNAAHYLPTYWEMGRFHGHTYGLPSVPAVVGLHWNKDLFREAGLDPERPPATLAELDQFSKKLTKVENGRIVQMGFLPSQPAWWPFAWVFFFDGKLWDGGDTITIDSPENVQAFAWAQSYSKFYGVSALQNLSASFGNFASPGDPFMGGKVAMIFQGVWMANYIHNYAPNLDWGAAPFPSLKAGGPPAAMTDSDMLMIPRGARHAREAFEFMKYVAQQGPSEKLCAGQLKNSPLREVSEAFFAKHKHPYIRMFQALAASPRAQAMPGLSVWHEYRGEIANAFQRVWLLEATPEQALGDVKRVLQKSWDRERKRERILATEEPSLALKFAPFGLVGLLVGGLVLGAARGRRRAAGAGGALRSARANASLLTGLAFFSPWGVGLTVLVAFPVLASAVYSLCDYSVLTAPRFVGLQNFADLLGDGAFWIALKNTLIYTAFALPLGLVIAFLSALLLDANVRGTSIYRTLIFLPSLTPLVASAMVWLWIFNAEYGVLNHLLSRLTFGAVAHVPWLSSRTYAMPALILMSFWGVGQTAVIMLAAMQDVPVSVYEAADIDGASFWQKVRHITIPLTSPVIYFNAIIGLIGALQVFAAPYIMTEGGPARATLFYTMRLYENAFTFLRMGYACAMAWILFLITLGLTLLAYRVGRSRVHYTADV